MFSESNFSQVRVRDYQNIHYPTFFEGMATIADLRGKLLDIFIEQAIKTNDEDAIRSDWEKVRGDFMDVIKRTRTDFLKYLAQSTKNIKGDIPEELVRNAFTKAMANNIPVANISGNRL